MHVLTIVLAAAMATASPHAMHTGGMQNHAMKSHTMTSSHTSSHMNGHMNSHMSGHMSPQPKKTP